ncbi:Armadillo/beta-catenin-like repeat protein [Dictyocaulus viviparus]|uniref:Armadillo/beta-catenin-like repeat protein n=1 Tax=Dictyocaulus viviparus TaxID=29172 RepID=A0A0D8Y2P5_DICVI|nr:Armadillo/beta-catenin-like repeat protein [Dictyocaulus viviparus]
MRGDVLVGNQTQSMNFGGGVGNGSEYINDLYRTYQDAETIYTESRASRIRAAMFPESEAGPSGISRSTIIEQMTLPTRLLKTAVIDLLSLEGTSDISALPVPDLIDLISDRDEAVVARAVQRVYLISKEDRSIVSYPALIDALIKTVVQYAVTTLRNLLIHVDTVKAQARILGAIEALAPLLLKNNWKFLALVADSLYFLLLDDPQSKIVFLSLGGPQTLVQILNHYSDFSKLMYTVIRCIRSLSVCQQNKAALISLGCIPALYKEMCTATDDRMLLAILVALRNLSDAATNEDNLAPLVQDPIVVRLLEIVRVADAAQTSCACGILSNLTCNNVRNKQTVCSNHGVESLVEAIRRFPDVEEATEPALCALRHCTARHSFAEQAQQDLRLCRSFPILLQLLATLRAPVIKAALGVIRNSALLRANLLELTQEISDRGETVLSLTVDILGRAAATIREDPMAESDGVPIWGVVEGVTPILVEAMRSEHKSVATYASGVLKNLESDKPVPYRQDLDAELSSGWQRDGLEPELFGEMYPVHGMERIDQFPTPPNNSSWFDTDL